MALDMNDKITKVSYALGMNIVNNLKQQGLETINAVALAEGIQDVLSGSATQINDQEANQTLQSYFGAIQKKQGESASAEGQAFLAENAKKDTITVTATGLQYEILTEGSGKQPAATDQVTVHYRGTLLNGKQFDSSYDRGQPATFGLNQVIAGWTEGVQLMKEGAKYRFYIPYNLAYGERGAGADIPPYAALIFDVELIKVA